MSNNSARVLLADDDEVASLVARAALDSAGFEVACASDGLLAVEEFNRHRPDCVILDVVMPRLNGYEACRQIRAAPGGADLPILVMTSRDDVEAVAEAYESGATDFASKGISSRLLIERVRFLLRENASRQALVVSRGRLAIVQSLARIGHWEVDGAGRTLHVSTLVKAVLGSEDTAPAHLAHLVTALRPEAGKQLLDAFRDWQSSGRAFRMEAALRSGSHLHIHGTTTPASKQAGRATLTLAVQDVSELRQAQRQAHRLANFDTLTGLPNRKQFLERLQHTIGSRSASEALWVVAFKLRGLERLLQSLGQAASDAALVEAARLVGDTVEPGSGDSFAHIGGGEFVLCRPACGSPAAAGDLADRVARTLAAPLSGRDWTANFQVGAGIVAWPGDGADAETLLENALATASRNVLAIDSTHEFFSAEVQQQARRLMEIETALHGALERGELSLAYQPRVSLPEKTIRGSEALMRWTHPRLGSVPPGEFIPVAEESGLIAQLGSWALKQACGQTAAWRAATGRDLNISVNVSAHQLKSPRTLVEDVLLALEDSGLPTTALELELTESAFIEAAADARAALQQLRDLGISIALDDFGTGYSSLSYLRRLPVDCLKVDRSFVSDLGGDEDATRVLDAILGIAGALRIRAVAEGVETDAQLALLCRHSCHEAQGYLISRPLAVPAFDLLLADLPLLVAPTPAVKQRQRRRRA
jgi:predicted signal transduction protein with EAL and GGDEF domain/DNA-binding response OmpR family regulator